MKTLYIDCGMGAAGDMLTAALLELLPENEAAEFVNKMNEIGLPGVTFVRERSVKCGITGTHMSVRVDGEEEQLGRDVHAHHHSGMQEIVRVVEALRVDTDVKEDVLSVYRLIAEAESHVHGKPVSEIHFHEVGSRDAVADITAVCLLMKYLSPDEVVVSPVHVGSGQVSCAHGILPVPAPATAYLLKNVPIYGGAIRGELCTPTGAALLTHFADRFGDMPVLKPVAVGYGMGKKDFEAANCVRVILGESKDTSELIFELSCNVDDMTAEDIGFAMERLYESGALEVYTIPVGMKKNRPGTLLRVMCTEEKKQALVECLFCHTSTLGIRETETRRYILKRKMETVSTPYGDVRVKSVSGYGVSRAKYEYEDLARIARERGIGLSEVRRLLQEQR